MKFLPVWVKRMASRQLSTARHFRDAYPDTIKAAYGRFDYLRDSLSWETYEMTPGRNREAFRYLKKVLAGDSTYVDLHTESHLLYASPGGDWKVCPWDGCHLRDIEIDSIDNGEPTFSALQPFSHGPSSATSREDLLLHLRQVEDTYLQVKADSLPEADWRVSAWLCSVTEYLLSVMRPDFSTSRKFSSELEETDAVRMHALLETKEQLMRLLVMHSA